MNRKIRKRNSKAASQFDYQGLEPRKLLAGFHQMPATLPEGINLIVNGDFSSFETGEVENFFRADQVPGWNVVGLDGERQLDFQLNIMPYQGLGHVLDLDSTAFNFDQVYQDVATEMGRQYILSFDFKANPVIFAGNHELDLTEHTSDFEVWWGGSYLANFTAGQDWQTGTLRVTGGPGETTRLMFSEIVEGFRDAGDGIGALLNNVRVVAAVTSPIRNGGFESVEGTPVDGKYPNHAVDGWNAIGPSPSERGIRIVTPEPDEIQPRHGQRMLNLNANDNFRDAVFQDFTTVPGATYFLRFFARSEHGDSMRVRWNDQWATTLTPSAGWQSYGILVEADSTNTQVAFLEGSDQNRDIFIDTVSLVRIDPAGVNRPPMIQSFGDRTVDFGQPITFEIEASDPDGDDFEFALSHTGILNGHNLPTISQSGQITWTPSQAGDFELTVRATDTFGAFSEMNFSVTVSPFVPLSGTRALAAVPTQFRNDIYASASESWPNQRPPQTIDETAEYQAVVDTTAGEFTLRLFPQEAPITVNSFVALANDGFFDGLAFHRVIDGFMAQGGDPLGSGLGGPGYRFLDEVNNGLQFNRAGLLAMANAGPGTNGSQFFITFDATLWLNNLHTIFGEIIGDDSSFNNIVRTHSASNQPIPGVQPTIINSITINVNPMT